MPSQCPASGFQIHNLEGNIYEPYKKRKRRRNPDQAEDATGQIVLYSHGYLKAQAKAARGVFPTRKRKSPPFVPPVVPDCGIELLYVLELGRRPALIAGHLIVDIWWRPVGQATALRPLVVNRETTVPTTADQRLLQLLAPFQERQAGARGNRFQVPSEAQPALWAALAEARQVRWSAREETPEWQLHRLTVQETAAPWFVTMRQQDALEQPQVFIGGTEEDIPFDQWEALGRSGWAVANGVLYPIKFKNEGYQILQEWFGRPLPLLTAHQADNILQSFTVDGGPDLSRLDEAQQVEIEDVEPTGKLFITTARFKHLGQEQLQCTLSFQYDGVACADGASAPRLSAPGGRVIRRSPEAEERLRDQLRQLGFRLVTRTGGDEDPGWKLLPARLDGAVQTLVLAGWEITAEGKSYRRPTSKSLAVCAFGIDWLELKAEVDFDGHKLALPELLRISRSGQKTVRLDDGTYGILPMDWLANFTVLTEIGLTDDSQVRFRQEQAALLHALLAEQLQDLDGRYYATLQKLQNVPAAMPTDAPPGFLANLRPYQKAGLGWLLSLQRLRLGGILADDMGLGKTIQVLALLAGANIPAQECAGTEQPAQECAGTEPPDALPDRNHGYAGTEQPSPLLPVSCTLYPVPSLVVMPSSLLFNWASEAKRFAPQLRVGQYYGASRQATAEWFAQYDLVFTTYGTLRQDFAKLAKIHFRYVVLDESQAIKNAESATAKAARTLKAEFRLAMTGTPIENHLAELFSQLAFLNPGLFSERFVAALGRESALLAPGSDTARRLRQYVAPFLLRRRKEQVAADLPAKTEQVLWCELDTPQRYYYDELRDYYRQEFGNASETPTQANMLGALLRLRQAACHAGLVNPSCEAVSSAKITLLHEHLGSLLEAGHKVLVFSQFTQLLKAVEKDIQAAQWQYCYLDGQTKNRGELVKKFQEDASVGIFLISLKAGGVGLNLTAADYVYILDPWWNPAAEAQAIDRAYRIGQTRPVFAYRMIARDTVEEKVLEMQNRKRAIANAVLSADTGGLDAIPPAITAEQLQELFIS